MTHLFDIAEQIRETERHLAVLEGEAAQFPDDHGIGWQAASFKKQRSQLEMQFQDRAKEIGVPVCTYRAFGTGSNAYGKVCQIIGEFQRLYSLIFASIESGKRNRRMISAADERKTTFGFRYAFTGSFGVTLTLAQDRELFEELVPDNHFDKAMSVFCELAQLQEASALRAYATDFGVGVIRELYAWGKLNAEFDIGADVNWFHGKESRQKVFVQPQELTKLTNAIEVMSDTHEGPVVAYPGVLKGVDLSPPSFHLVVDGGPDIRGTFEDAISEDRPLPIPIRCVAHIKRIHTIKYATDEEFTQNILVKLTPVG